MAKIDPREEFGSEEVYKKFGESNGFGNIIFGFNGIGVDNSRAAIYRRRPGPERTTIVKMRFYRNPVQRTAEQATQRDKLKAANLAWLALTDEERAAWCLQAEEKTTPKLPILRGYPVPKLKQEFRTTFRGVDIFKSDYIRNN